MHDISKRINFLKTTIFDSEVAAVTMSSQYVVKRVLKHLPDILHTVVELGPGEGVMTRALLPRMSPEGTLFAIETNTAFIHLLKRIPDSRLRVIQDKAQDFVSHLDAKTPRGIDLVIASIPFTYISASERLGILNDAYHNLAANGSLVIFNQHTPLMYKAVKSVFGSATLLYELRNIPPCFIMHAKK